LVLSAPDLERRAEALGASIDLSALARRLTERAAPLLARPPKIPEAKALLSRNGGVCPADGAMLTFDPWSPGTHRCPRCGRSWSGERHDRAWARFQHLWLGERAASLATVAAITGHQGAAAGAARILGGYADTYFTYPNRDNVLGPARLFFSTYLESIWLTNYLAAASLLRECGLLDEALAGGVGVVAEEAANLIGEFDEGLSNRQTWHNAALAAIAVWFEDEELAARAVHGPTGMLAHLLQGFGDDGLWYEGENYHLFALRGQLVAMGWARQAGVDLLEDERLGARLAAALRAPALSALPDYTFPARKDSRFGLSLAQPMYLELWEVGLARLGDAGSELWSWLRELYAGPAPPAQPFDSYLHEAGELPPVSRSRAELSWWALLEMAPELPGDGPAWSPGSTLLESQGLAIFRDGSRYTSVECGRFGGGHGHPDRLHLTFHAGGHGWQLDPGAGSYVAPDLPWYRSTLAHGAPRLDGRSQPAGDAYPEAFDVQAGWSWARGRFGELARTVVAGPYVLDVVERNGADERLLELAWHPAGEVQVTTPGGWAAAELDDAAAAPFVDQVERFTGRTDAGVTVRATIGGDTFTLHLRFEGELLRATGPGLPERAERRTFLIVRARARLARLVAVLESGRETSVRGVTVRGDAIEVETAAGVDRHLAVAAGWEIAGPSGTARLGGLRRPPTASRPLIDLDRRTPPVAIAPAVRAAPVLDGTLDAFDVSEPIVLDHEDQYRRSEEPYTGPEEFSATAVVNWDEDGLYLGVDVVKPEVVTRPDDAPPLLLDNEPDDIHADGLQIYLRPEPDGPTYGFLVALADGGALRVTPVAGTAAGADMLTGAWQTTGTGYAATLCIAPPEWRGHTGQVLGFDLLVNEMQPGRERRAGQLVWSGGGGWVYLRGDRQPTEAFGELELR
jgi:heparinase II/III-like protein